jgi:hypothetical protein
MSLVSVVSVRFNQNWISLSDLSKNSQVQISTKVRPLGAMFFHTNRQTDRRPVGRAYWRDDAGSCLAKGPERMCGYLGAKYDAPHTWNCEEQFDLSGGTITELSWKHWGWMFRHSVRKVCHRNVSAFIGPPRICLWRGGGDLFRDCI